MSGHHQVGTTNVVTRKKRRGMIEKRRRDKINNSLCELRRLVPAAFEKQSSAKLEKAEILQMTVDYLKTLHARGLADPLTSSCAQQSLSIKEDSNHHISPQVQTSLPMPQSSLPTDQAQAVAAASEQANANAAAAAAAYHHHHHLSHPLGTADMSGVMSHASAAPPHHYHHHQQHYLYY